MRPNRPIPALAALLALAAASAALAAKKQRPYRLKGVSLRQRIIWGAELRRPTGEGLAFGGQHQSAPDGRPHTRILEGGAWKPIHRELQAKNPLQKFYGPTWTLRTALKNLRARLRHLYLEGLAPAEETARVSAEANPGLKRAAGDLARLLQRLDAGRKELAGDYEKGQVAFALEHLRAADKLVKPVIGRLSPRTVKGLRRAQVHLELAAETLDAEPPPRALSPIAYDEKTGLYVLFGGDHLDYLTNDTWVFDPKDRRWYQRHPEGAPPPRANHSLIAKGDGTVELVGGYFYADATWYLAGQYLDYDDGTWRYDIEKDRWTAPAGGKLVPADSRRYRTGPFSPDFYLQDPRPDAAHFQERLEALPENTFVSLAPPYKPRQNRDWGSAVIDPARDLILYWSGGHSAHGGTDVLHLHLATGRWELPFPVEFPLGQLYSNTSYPGGFNFNLRPWMTGHTYNDYNIDPPSGLMLETGHRRHFYIYDPTVADWVGRGVKPKGMTYNSAFYTLTVAATPKGAVCWTRTGKVFLYQADKRAWKQLELAGGKLPGSVVDNSSAVYDSRRNRILFFRKPYGRHPYDGRVYALDLDTLAVKALEPSGSAGAAAIAGLDRATYDAENDLVLFASYVRGEGDRLPIPAYDCAGNRFLALDIAYKVVKRNRRTYRLFPHGHSCGIVYDPKRKLVWGVTTNGEVYALRLAAERANARVLEAPTK